MAKKSTEKTYRRLIKRCMEEIARLEKKPENEAIYELIKARIAKYARHID